MKKRIINQAGFAHYFLLGLIVVGVAVGGTYELVTSHADSLQPETAAPSTPDPNDQPLADPTTTIPLRKSILAFTTGQLGVHEVPNNSNKIPGDPYHSNPQAWCAYFVSWVWQHAGVTSKNGKAFPRYENAQQFKDWGKSNGRWHSLSSNYSPKVGDAVVFTNGVHIAQVAAVKSGKIEIIGGNYGNAVAYQTNTNGKHLGAPSTFAVKEDDGTIHHIDGFVSPN